LPDDQRDARFQTQTTIRRLLAEAGIAPRKRYGQHFLIDRNLMNRLIQAAEIGPSDCILEVGGGTGSLTGLLAETGAKIVAVEIDKLLGLIAARSLADCPNVSLLQLDVLAGKSTLSPDLVTAVRSKLTSKSITLKLVANLPYDIATPLVIDLLLSDLPFARLCFTVQAEVGDRFLAPPGGSDYGPVSVITQALCTGQRIGKVPPRAFWPAPKVASIMIRLDPMPAAARPINQSEEFARFVRGFFLHRRKTLGHLIRNHPKSAQIHSALAAEGIEPIARPETVTVPQWIHLFHAVQ
jgi:16S rRNA (adenine1518-N6/adenine1519-N6)-dimethyltransferase